MPIDLDATVLGLSVLELVAAGLGVISVGLTVRQVIWCWPVGLVMVALYAWVFWRQELYAAAGLQVFFFAMQVYGWYEWSRGRDRAEPLPVRRATTGLLVGLIVAGAVATPALGYALAHTSDPAPYTDAGLFVFSLIAQWMMARKLLEHWAFWVVIDVVSVGLFWHQGLHPTAVLYLIFLGLATAGYFAWRRSMRAGAAS